MSKVCPDALILFYPNIKLCFLLTGVSGMFLKTVRILNGHYQIRSFGKKSLQEIECETLKI